MTILLNGWTGENVGWKFAAGNVEHVELVGVLIPGEDTWGKPAYVVDDGARPDRDYHFGSVLTVLADGRVIPYRHYHNLGGHFDLSGFFYPVAPVAAPPTLVSDPPVPLPMDAPLLTAGERSLAWLCFWPEWVVRQAAKYTRQSWQYLVALHTLWSKEQRGGRDDGEA
jgi:hypothetical protein